MVVGIVLLLVVGFVIYSALFVPTLAERETAERLKKEIDATEKAQRQAKSDD